MGRDLELALISAQLEGVRSGEGAWLVIEGEAGIGKTRLVASALQGARHLGMRTLHATAVPLETDFAFGIARQLFEPVRRELEPERWDELTSGAAGFASRALGSPEVDEADPAGHPSFATLHGLYWLVANLSTEVPVLLAVDDVQWADRPSLRFLAHLARRLEGLPVAVVLAIRSGEQPADELLISDLLAAGGPNLRLAPLDEHDSSTLVRSQLGEGADPTLCLAVHCATGGNPFLLRALTEALGCGEVERSAEAVDSLHGVRLESVARSLLRRLSLLPDGSGAFATAVATLGGEPQFEVTSALAGLEIATATHARDALRGAGILAPRGALAFVHPVVRSAVYEGMTATERRSLHLRAADLLADRAAPTEHVAMHYLAIEGLGDPGVVSTLRAAAGQASSRGAPEVAASYLRRALAEPPPPEDQSRIRLELALASIAAETPDSVAGLIAAVHGLSDPGERAEAALAASIQLGFNGDSADVISLCEAGLRSGGVIDRDLTARLESEWALWGLLNPPTVADSVDWVRRATNLGEPTTEPAAAVGAVWLRLVIDAEPGDLEVARLVALVEDGSLFARPSAVLVMGASWMLVIGGRPELAREVATGVSQLGEQQGSALLTRAGSYWRGVAECVLGQIAEASADSQTAFEIALEGAGGAEGLAYSGAAVIDSLVEAGEPDEAERALSRAALGVDLPSRAGFALLVESRGRLRSAQLRFEEAAADALEAGRRWAVLGVRSPVPTSWRGDAALALHQLDDSDSARRLAVEQLELARAVAEPRTLGAALRVLGEIGEGADGRALTAEAVEVLTQSPARLELGKALLAHGRTLRRDGARAAAREPLARALDIAHRGGAGRLAELAGDELRACGGRPRRPAISGPQSLTPAERRVTELAAANVPNREIAQRLFVSLRTVETHLTHAYGKLEISSRTELSGALATDV